MSCILSFDWPFHPTSVKAFTLTYNSLKGNGVTHRNWSNSNGRNALNFWTTHSSVKTFGGRCKVSPLPSLPNKKKSIPRSVSKSKNKKKVYVGNWALSFYLISSTVKHKCIPSFFLFLFPLKKKNQFLPRFNNVFFWEREGWGSVAWCRG